MVLGEASRLLDDVGYQGLTLSAIADRFGVAVPSLYKHIDGMEHLQQLLADRSVRELGEALATAAVGKARGDALRAMADAYRSYALEHPGRYAATLQAPDPEDAGQVAASEAVLGTVFAVLDGYGLAGDDAVDAARAVRSALHGFVTLETAGGFRMPQQVDRSYARLVDTLDRVLTDWSPQPTPTAREGTSL